MFLMNRGAPVGATRELPAQADASQETTQTTTWEDKERERIHHTCCSYTTDSLTLNTLYGFKIIYKATHEMRIIKPRKRKKQEEKISWSMKHQNISDNQIKKKHLHPTN